MINIIAPCLAKAGTAVFAERCLEVIVSTGPPLKAKPYRYSVIAEDADIQTLKGFLQGFLEYNKASDAY